MQMHHRGLLWEDDILRRDDDNCHRKKARGLPSHHSAGIVDIATDMNIQITMRTMRHPYDTLWGKCVEISYNWGRSSHGKWHGKGWRLGMSLASWLWLLPDQASQLCHNKLFIAPMMRSLSWSLLGLNIPDGCDHCELMDWRAWNLLFNQALNAYLDLIDLLAN